MPYSDNCTHNTNILLYQQGAIESTRVGLLPTQLTVYILPGDSPVPPHVHILVLRVMPHKSLPGLSLRVTCTHPGLGTTTFTHPGLGTTTCTHPGLGTTTCTHPGLGTANMCTCECWDSMYQLHVEDNVSLKFNT